ncbi:hypothetical protein E4T56_gene8114 [Termitomyces sp. T112]|nr:hypothetical protein E4T56_gene8114 [Termitomyces sp. T112]
MSDLEIFHLCSKFDIEILEEASYVLWHVWKTVSPRYSTLQACITALTEDSKLYEVLKRAHFEKKYDTIRSWTSPSPQVEHKDSSFVSKVNKLLTEIRPAIARLAAGNLNLPAWVPKVESCIDAEAATHLGSLHIPCLNGRPNVLLHDLGSFDNDPTLSARLSNIFMPNHHTFLVNTSGSGKTRLLLEGLCHQWGFYFTSLVDSSLLGSSDVQNTIRHYVPDSRGFKSSLPQIGSPLYELSLNNNRQIANRILGRLFLARLLVFNVFVDVMNEQLDIKNLDDARTTAYKKHWLLLQLQPNLVHPRIWDIFDDLTCKLSEASESYINTTTQTLLSRVRKLCVDKSALSFEEAYQTPIFCVLDEAQYAATQHSLAFRSENGAAHRPILREIVRAWESQTSGQGVFMVVAGTGISKDVVDQAMASAIMKESKYRWCSDTGAFDDEAIQRRYIEKFFPPTLLSSASGKRLLDRVWYWLHGRHRFTAGYIAELLNHGFRSPHTLLNRYIEFFTDFRPTDAQRYVDAEDSTVSISSRYRLDFHKLTKNSDMIDTIHQLTTHYLMRSVLPRSLGQDEKIYVEYGFARFKDADTNTVAIDEPLVLLAAAHWIDKNYRTSYKLFAERIKVHDASSNGFENYLAFCLNLAFSEKQRVDKIFTFCGTPPAWAQQEAEIVSLHYTSNGIEISPVRQSTGPSITLGINAKTTDETSVWLLHECPNPICFPHLYMGPDLLFVLRLADNSNIWVAVQAKYSIGKNGMLSRLFLRRAIRSVTPSNFFINKEGNPFSPELVTKTLDSLSSLPHRRSDAGVYSLLRIVASFPAQPGLKRCFEEDPDDHHHPIASLNMNFLKLLTKRLSPVNFLDSLEEKVATSGQTLTKRTRKNSGLRSVPRKRLKI